MNPNIAFGGGGGGMSPTGKMDMRIGSVIIAACVAVILAFVADTAVFVKEPESHIEAIVSYTAVIGYFLTENRVMTFLFSFFLYFTTLAVVGYVIFLFMEIYIIEPLKVKWKMIYVKREKVLMNKYDDGSI